jgi:transcriptional regulator with XRE-family HTH domain
MPHECSINRALPDMRGYSLPAALRMAFALSGKSDDEIAAAMGWGSSTANRIFHNQDYWPSLPTLPKLCVVLGNTVVPRWITDNADFLTERARPMDASQLFKALRGMMRETAELLEAGERALTDGKIESLEARRVLRELEDIFKVGASMLAGLQAVLQEGGKP